MSNGRTGFAADAINWARGLCMGAADIVPGVSGGTIALILGHYERLLTAISHFDAKLLRQMKSGRVKEALKYIDFRFLLGLGGGILTGIVGFASLMHYLLQEQAAYTYASFGGLILGSSYLIALRLNYWNLTRLMLFVLGGLAAWQICVLNPTQANLNPLSAFLAATVAICAMILPGVSGAFVLLLLGLYHPITELIKGLPRGEITSEGLLVIAAFGGGCAVGLLAFSRLLKWLLNHRHDATMAFLVGLMVGSLYKVWPFQRVTEATAVLPFKEQRFSHVWPGETPASVPLVLLIAALAIVATLLLDRLGRKLV
jgi:putative membrane protein